MTDDLLFEEKSHLHIIAVLLTDTKRLIQKSHLHIDVALNKIPLQNPCLESPNLSPFGWVYSVPTLYLHCTHAVPTAYLQNFSPPGVADDLALLGRSREFCNAETLSDHR